MNKLTYKRGCFHGKVATPTNIEGVYTFCWGYYSLIPGECFYIRRGNEVLASSSFEWEAGRVDKWELARSLLRGGVNI